MVYHHLFVFHGQYKRSNCDSLSYLVVCRRYRAMGAHALWQERHGDAPAASGVMEVMALQAAYLVLMIITIGWAANPLAATAVFSSIMLLTSSLVSARNAKIIMR
jgi:hypothetical protein